MAEIVPLRDVSLRNTVVRINVKFDEANTAERKHDRSRLAAGQMLVELRARIEAGEDGDGVRWWDWYRTAGFIRGRRDAEKCMKIASSEAPDIADEVARERAREGMRRLRAAPPVSSDDVAAHAANVSRKKYDPEQRLVEDALRIVADLMEEMNDTQQRTFFARLREDYQW